MKKFHFDTNILVRTIYNRIYSGKYESKERILEQIDSYIQELMNSQEDLLQTYQQISECKHDFDLPSRSITERMIGFTFVYRRTCQRCGYEETAYEENGIPDWWIND